MHRWSAIDRRSTGAASESATQLGLLRRRQIRNFVLVNDEPTTGFCATAARLCDFRREGIVVRQFFADFDVPRCDPPGDWVRQLGIPAGINLGVGFA